MVEGFSPEELEERADKVHPAKLLNHWAARSLLVPLCITIWYVYLCLIDLLYIGISIYIYLYTMYWRSLGWVWLCVCVFVCFFEFLDSCIWELLEMRWRETLVKYLYLKLWRHIWYNVYITTTWGHRTCFWVLTCLPTLWANTVRNARQREHEWMRATTNSGTDPFHVSYHSGWSVGHVAVTSLMPMVVQDCGIIPF